MIRPTDSAYVRSHVDLVLLNPNFIEWIKKYDKPYEYIKGLRNELFSNYIREFVSRYSEFYHETKETVLLYALGFNYFRVGYEGAKYPLLDIKQDVEKLKSVKSFKIGSFMYDELHFSRKILSLVFVGDKSKKILARDLHDDPVVKLISK
jgi:hypothetical protein